MVTDGNGWYKHRASKCSHRHCSHHSRATTNLSATCISGTSHPPPAGPARALNKPLTSHDQVTCLTWGYGVTSTGSPQDNPGPFTESSRLLGSVPGDPKYSIRAVAESVPGFRRVGTLRVFPADLSAASAWASAAPVADPCFLREGRQKSGRPSQPFPIFRPSILFLSVGRFGHGSGELLPDRAPRWKRLLRGGQALRVAHGTLPLAG